jgi:hypothetical protein
MTSEKELVKKGKKSAETIDADMPETVLAVDETLSIRIF